MSALVPGAPADVTAGLEARARAVRAATVRMAHDGRTPHVGSALSCVDILVALYFHAMRIDPARPNALDHDVFVLSKGHGCMSYYATLAERGYFDRALLASYAQNGGALSEHPTPNSVPGVTVATGSLGHGLAMAAGIALARALDGRPGRAFALLSDGECNEGSVWEAAMFAAGRRLERLVAIVDYNKLQAMGRSEEITALAPLAEKWRAFGWGVREIDGHDMGTLVETLDAVPFEAGRPSAIVAHTVKGKGVSFMEDDTEWHYRPPSDDDLVRALAEIGGTAMRNAFVRALTEAAVHDPRIVFLTGDLGFKLFDDFAARNPGRFFNVGVAEATMAGVAAGLALEGKKPFIYSIVPFATLRCYEQIRNDICYHEADVTIVGVGGGYSYGPNGPTHHALEDIAVLRALPNITIVCPGDPAETVGAVQALVRHRGPAYLRLGRAGEPAVHPGPVTIRIGESLRVREGTDVALLSTGNMLATAVRVADLLGERGVGCRVVSMPTVKPLDVAAIEDALRSVRAVGALEEHSVLGGFGSAVAEHVAELGVPTRFRRFGARDGFSHACGDQEYHRVANGLTPAQIADVLVVLAGARP